MGTGGRLWGMGLVLGAALLGACGGTTDRSAECLVDGGTGDGAPPPEENATYTPTTSVKLPAEFEIAEGLSIVVPASGSWKQSNKLPGYVDNHLQGELQVVTPFYTFTLGHASLSIKVEKYRLQSLSGTAKVVMPALHTFSGLGLEGGPLSASFGYDTGAHLASLGLPLAKDRKYLYYTTTTGYKGSFATGSFTAAADTSMTKTIVVDPMDPAILIAGPMGDVEAIGLSEKSLIPFTAETTWGFEQPGEEFPTFGGQGFIAGNIPLEEFPVTINGNVTTKFIGWDGQTSFEKGLFEKAIGVNGYFNLGWQALDGVFTFEIPVAQASLYIESSARPYKATAAFSGTAKSLTFLPPWLPIDLTSNAALAAYVDTADVSRNHLDGASALKIQTNTLGKAIGLNMNDITLAAADFHLDRLGFKVSGRAKLEIPPHLVSANAKITACFGGDTQACMDANPAGVPVMGSKDWLIHARGSATVGGVPLASMTSTINDKGFAIEATFKTQKQSVTMKGSVAPGDHVNLGGNATLAFNLEAGNEVLKAVTDGAKCGYKIVTSAAMCGEDTLDFSDEFHCGKPHCKWSWKHGLRCSGFSCSIKVPKTCRNLDAPKTCVPKPDKEFNLGRVEGTVGLKITNDGIDGELSGTFCFAGGGCQSLSKVGKLDFSHVTAPEFCIHSHEIAPSPILPNGKFCVEF